MQIKVEDDGSRERGVFYMQMANAEPATSIRHSGQISLNNLIDLFNLVQSTLCHKNIAD